VPSDWLDLMDASFVFSYFINGDWDESSTMLKHPSALSTDSYCSIKEVSFSPENDHGNDISPKNIPVSVKIFGGPVPQQLVQAVCSEKNGWLICGIYDGELTLAMRNSENEGIKFSETFRSGVLNCLSTARWMIDQIYRAKMFFGQFAEELQMMICLFEKRASPMQRIY
ncbi:hypothetical protein ACJX0J_012240, partial [Zea mays]